ncbi:MBL fold metallo-hydrolase RNA specificity domain-containing protein, partial [Nostoc sp. NIES-2111]
PEQPTVVVCGSADGCGGAAAAWLPVLLRDPRNIIATTGYTAARSVMGQTVRLAELPLKERRRHPGSITWPDGRSFLIRDVAAAVTSLKGYSAHADQTDLLAWVFLRRQDGDGVVAPTLFIQHGEDRARTALRDTVLKQAANRGERVCVQLPQPADEWHSLDMTPDSVA